MVHHDGSDTSNIAELHPDIDVKDTYVGVPIKAHWSEERSGGLMDIEYYDKLEDDSEDIETK